MPDLESELHFAWLRIAAGFAANPDDPARRLARRRRAVLVQPPRACCLALRASDAHDDKRKIRRAAKTNEKPVRK